MLNKVILTGRLTADPELKQTSNNLSNCRFTVAVDRNFVAQGEERQADFITIVAWRQTAEFISKYFSKGAMISIEGNLRTGSYADKKYPDVKHYTTEVFADHVYFAGSKKDNKESSSPGSNQQSPPHVDDGSTSLAIGNLSEFEEILGDGQLPF